MEGGRVLEKTGEEKGEGGQVITEEEGEEGCRVEGEVGGEAAATEKRLPSNHRHHLPLHRLRCLF